MSKFDRSIEISKKLFPMVEKIPGRYRTFHFAFIWQRNNLLSVGINDPYNVNAKAIYFASLFNINHFGTLHAEIDAISKLWGKIQIGKKHDMIVIRLNKWGELGRSDPCNKCSKVLSNLKFKKILSS